MRIFALAACLFVIGAALGLGWASSSAVLATSHIVSHGFTVPPSPASLNGKSRYRTTGFSVHCPAGQLVTGGGFRAHVRDHTAAYLDEHCALWKESHGIEVSRITMSRAIRRAGFTRKEGRWVPVNAMSPSAASDTR